MGVNKAKNNLVDWKIFFPVVCYLSGRRKNQLKLRKEHLIMDSTPERKHLMNAEEIAALIDRIAQEICDRNKKADPDDFVFIGIHRGGVPLAERLVKCIEKKAGFQPRLGMLDISMYRDDIGMRKTLPLIFETRIPFDINGKTIILVDDVLQSGRSIRAALDAITDYGRPADRGLREFPINADYVGRFVDVPPEERIKINWHEYAGEEDYVYTVRNRKESIA